MGDTAKVPSPPAGPQSSPSPLPVAESPPPAPPIPSDDNVPLYADENPEEDDLGIAVGAESDTTSLKSSILRYRTENGRTYHSYKDGAYVVPNDDLENERLDIQHTIFHLTWDGKLYCAPIAKQSARVLDVGCGTGIWSVEFADDHPDSHVTGTDLSPIQPAFVPPNLGFLIDDAEDDWEFSLPFDFVFARMITGSLKDMPRFFRQSYDNLNPGGFIELQDVIYPALSDDDTLPEDSPLKRWSVLINEAFRGNGRPLDSALHYEKQLADAGFTNIHVIREKWPQNRWPRDKKYKQLGIWGMDNYLSGISAWTLAIFTRPTSENGLGWSKEEVEVLLAGVRNDVKNTNIHAYLRVWSVYAQKP